MERWRVEWQSIEDRIVGLQNTASMVLEALRVQGLSHENLCNLALKPTLLEVVHALEVFHGAYRNALSPLASDHLKRGLERVQKTKGTPPWQSVQAMLTSTAVLAGLRAEVSASLVDLEATGRQRTERAFEHLSRSIVVDDGYRKRWQVAYKRGEVECERLGAVHLLLHGIWAFKAHAPGERTDLVLQEKLAIDRKVEAADALVLTEWKVARKHGEVKAKATEGKAQALTYKGSSLAATELTTIRYIVLVTNRREAMPDEEKDDDGKVYYFINVAVSPHSPSGEARRKKGLARGPRRSAGGGSRT